MLAMAVALFGCGNVDEDTAFCIPQGRVSVGAIGTVGTPLQDFADCYAGAMPVVSLDQARAATATGNTVDFDDDGLSASIDANTCRAIITYTFDGMLGDGTPATGIAAFAAGPNPDGSLGDFDVDPSASIRFEWLDEGNETTCGNRVTGAVIAVE